jgi:hypothetical protein
VEGGRWKPLQYWYARYIFKDVLIAASADARVFVKNDSPLVPLVGTGSLSLLHTATGARTPVFSYPLNVPRGAGQSTWFCANNTVNVLTAACPAWPSILASSGCATDGSDCIALLAIVDTTGKQIYDNFELLNVPSQYNLPQAQVTFAIGSPAADGSVPITLTASATALFVTLTTLAQGRFSDNALLLSPGATTVSFIPWAGFDAALLASSLRVEHVASYARN